MQEFHPPHSHTSPPPRPPRPGDLDAEASEGNSVAASPSSVSVAPPPSYEASVASEGEEKPEVERPGGSLLTRAAELGPHQDGSDDEMD